MVTPWGDCKGGFGGKGKGFSASGFGTHSLGKGKAVIPAPSSALEVAINEFCARWRLEGEAQNLLRTQVLGYCSFVWCFMMFVL